METKVKRTTVSTLKTDKSSKFPAGNPVNEVAKGKEEQAEETTVVSGSAEPKQSAPKAEPNKNGIKAAFAQEKPGMNLEQTLKKIKE